MVECRKRSFEKQDSELEPSAHKRSGTFLHDLRFATEATTEASCFLSVNTGSPNEARVQQALSNKLGLRFGQCVITIYSKLSSMGVLLGITQHLPAFLRTR